MAYGVRMRSLRARVVRVMLGALVVASLAGCAASPVPAPTASTTPDAAAPLFASDEEALAAAEAAYAAYLAASDATMAQGDGDLREISLVVSEAYLAEIAPSFEDLAAKGLHTTGKAKFDSVSLVHQSIRTDGTGSQQIYVCQDISDVGVIGADGVLQPSTDRQERLSLIVTFVAGAPNRETLLVEGSEVWAGSDIC